MQSPAFPLSGDFSLHSRYNNGSTGLTIANTWRISLVLWKTPLINSILFGSTRLTKPSLTNTIVHSLSPAISSPLSHHPFFRLPLPLFLFFPIFFFPLFSSPHTPPAPSLATFRGLVPYLSPTPLPHNPLGPFSRLIVKELYQTNGWHCPEGHVQKQKIKHSIWQK